MHATIHSAQFTDVVRKLQPFSDVYGTGLVKNSLKLILNSSRHYGPAINLKTLQYSSSAFDQLTFWPSGMQQ